MTRRRIGGGRMVCGSSCVLTSLRIPFSVLVFSGMPEATETYISYQIAPTSSVDAWAPLELKWEEFVHVASEEDAGSPFDPAEPVLGMGFGLDGLESGANTGSLWVDDLQLVGVVTPGEPPTAEAVQVEAPQGEASEAGGSGLPCTGSRDPPCAGAGDDCARAASRGAADGVT